MCFAGTNSSGLTTILFRLSLLRLRFGEYVFELSVNI